MRDLRFIIRKMSLLWPEIRMKNESMDCSHCFSFLEFKFIINTITCEDYANCIGLSIAIVAAFAVRGISWRSRIKPSMDASAIATLTESTEFFDI